MNVRCPSCRTVFRVDPAKVPEAGVRARCTVCAATMDVRRDGAPAREPAPAAVQPAVAAVVPPAPPVAPEPPRPPAPTVETEAVTAVPPAPAARAGRLSQPFFPPRESRPPVAEPPEAPRRPSAPVFRATPGQPVTPAPAPPAPRPVASAPAAAPAAPAAPRPPAAPPRSPAPEATVEGARRPINPFLHQDPQQKARRLARALVSDMIVYQPEKRQRALAAGNLKEAFEEEIQKSWEEYVEQVGEEMARSTTYWREALNDILAGGKSVF